jgi:hypothetical protein
MYDVETIAETTMLQSYFASKALEISPYHAPVNCHTPTAYAAQFRRTGFLYAPAALHFLP